MQVNYTAPHWPWEGPGDEALARQITERTKAGVQPLPLLHVDGGSLARYGELVEAMDTGIGRILDALDETGQADDTLVVFCSDNGGERYSFMWPFLGEKGDLTEGGIRTPLIARWPVRMVGGQVSDAANIPMDWMATFVDAAGARPAPTHPMDGVSLLPWLVDGAPYPEHDLVWRCRDQGAIRRGRLKYLYDTRPRRLMPTMPRWDGPHDLLFDVADDGREVSGGRPRLNDGRGRSLARDVVVVAWHDFCRAHREFGEVTPSGGRTDGPMAPCAFVVGSVGSRSPRSWP